MKSSTPGRTRGSPPVTRTLRMPMPTRMRTSRSYSSHSSRLPADTCFSGSAERQYTQRKLQRSVTDTRRSIICRPNLSISGMVTQTSEPDKASILRRAPRRREIRRSSRAAKGGHDEDDFHQVSKTRLPNPRLELGSYGDRLGRLAYPFPKRGFAQIEFTANGRLGRFRRTLCPRKPRHRLRTVGFLSIRRWRSEYSV